MTTPAVNRSITLSRPCNMVHWNTGPNGVDSNPTTSLYANRNYFWDQESRPASGTVPPQPGGWRKCRPWNHSGRNFLYPPNSVTVSQLIAGPTWSRNRYENGCFWNVSVPSVPTIPNSLINESEIKALTNLKNQDFHLGVFMAEFDKTERMIANRLVRIASSVRKWRRSNPKQLWEKVKKYQRAGCGRRYARFIPRSWLELQYGWKPLLADIFGAVNALSKPGRDPVVSVKGYAMQEDYIDRNVGALHGAFCTMRFKVKHEVWTRLYYLLNSPGLANASSLGLINPVEIIWELTPYSFVVDWALPIGPWLGSLTADVGFGFIGGSSSRMSRIPDGGEVVRFSMPNTSALKVVGPLPEVTGSGFSFFRQCYTGSPVPGIYVKNPLSAIHVANAFALLVNAFSK